MIEPRNPFILGHRISRHYFCDRVEERKNLLSAVKNGRNVVLISPRRMGKTSLVYATLAENDSDGQDFLLFFIDILQTNSLKEFTYLLGKAIFDTLLSKNETRIRNFLAALKSLKGSFGFDAVSGLPTFNIQLGDIKDPEYTLDEIFKFIENTDRPIVIVIDEFQQITKYPERNVEAILRTHLQRLSNTSFIFAGSEQTILQEMFVSSKRPFYNSSEIMYLDAIPEDIYVAFAKNLFEERGRSIEDTPIKWAFSLFNGNTFYLQRTMNGAFADTPHGAQCGLATVRRSIKSMLATNEVVYREILFRVTTSQKAVLLAIAAEKVVSNPTSGAFIKQYSLPSASSAQSAIQKLIASGLISKTECGYLVSDALLRIFINETYSTSEIGD